MSLYKGASDNHSPWEYVFASTLATLVFEDEKAPEKLTIAKVEALRKVFGVIRKYEAENFDRALIDAIMEKKAKMILEATTMGAIHEIIKVFCSRGRTYPVVVGVLKGSFDP